MFKRITAIAAIGAVLAVNAGATAGAADQPKLSSYGAGAYATALELTLLGQDIAVSTTSAAINSNPQAKADGAALLLAGSPIPSAAPSAAPGGPASNQACAVDLDLAELTSNALDLLGLELACVNTSATVTDTYPDARSSSGELVIRITAPAGDVLTPIVQPLLEGVESLTDPLLDGLEALLGPIEDLTQIDVADVVEQLLNGLQGDETRFVVAEIAVAPSASATSASAVDGVVAEAGANGVTISLLPGIADALAPLALGIDLLNEPLATIKLGSAEAKVVRDPLSGSPTLDSSAAQLLDIELNNVLGVLETLTGAVEGVLDALSVDVLNCTDANPLADILCIELGRVNDLDAEELEARNLDFGGGTVGREASAATVRLLPILADTLGGDVLALRLGTATAAANAVAVLPKVVAQEKPEQKPMPKTGGETSAPLAMLLLAGAGATGALVRRSRTI